MLITAFVFPLLGCSSIESSLEQDEKVNLTKSSLRSPLQKRRSYCQNIYLESAFLQYATLFSLILFSRSPAATTKSLCRKGCLHGGSEFFSPLSFLQSLILHSFLLGRKLGLIVYIFIAMLFGGIYGAVSSLKGMEFLMAGDKTMIFIIGIPIGILFVVISFFLSLACYKKRYS